MDEWNAFEEKLRALPLTNKNARTFTRFFVAGATNCELDKQGEFLYRRRYGNSLVWKKTLCSPETSTELRYGAKRSGARIVIMMIWTVLQRVCRTWVSSSKHYAGKKSNRRRIWNLKHKSVLLEETIDGLRVKPDGTYVDGTLGGAGHAQEVCRRLLPRGDLLA